MARTKITEDQEVSDTIVDANVASNAAIQLSKLGTGNLTLINQGSVIFKELTANGTDTVTVEAPDDVTTSYTVKLPAVQASGTQVLQNDGSGNLSWATSPTTPVTVANGGTGDTTLTAHSVLLGEGTSNVAFAGPGTTNFALVSNGTSSDPTFQAIVNSLSATSNQTTVSSSTGSVTIGTVQNINTTSSPTFAGLTLTGQELEANGSSSAPSYSFTSDIGTGVYRDVQPTVSSINTNWNTTTHNVTATAHGLYQETPGQLTTTGTLPSGLSLATTYYVIWVDANTFALATTFANAANGVKIAFTTQGTGTHTFTPNSATNHNLGLTVNGTEVMRLTMFESQPQVFIGGSTQATQPSELIHAEGSGGVSGDFSADIIVLNTAGHAGRVLSASGGTIGSTTAYLTAFGSNDTGAFWSGGPNVASALEVALQNGSSQLFRIIGGATDTYFYNDNANATWHFNRATAGTVDATLTNGVLAIADGTVSLPGYSFSADTDAGLYRIGADDIALATNGVKQLEISTTAITAALSLAMGSNKITGLANGTASSDAAAFGQLKVLQTVQNTSTTSFTTTSGTFTNTNLSATITPTSSSNRILIMVSGILGGDTKNDSYAWTIVRGSTNLGGTQGFGYLFLPNLTGINLDTPVALTYIDSPATTSSTTYTVQVRANADGGTATFGVPSATQVMILMEVV